MNIQNSDRGQMKNGFYEEPSGPWLERLIFRSQFSNGADQICPEFSHFHTCPSACPPTIKAKKLGVHVKIFETISSYKTWRGRNSFSANSAAKFCANFIDCGDTFMPLSCVQQKYEIVRTATIIIPKCLKTKNREMKRSRSNCEIKLFGSG